MTGVAFDDVLVPGLDPSSTTSPVVSSTCAPAPVVSGAGSYTFSMSGAAIAPGQTCTWTLEVTSSSIGFYDNTVNVISNVATGISNTVTLAVVSAADVGISVTDGTTGVVAGDGTTHIFTIAVTNSGPGTAVSTPVTAVWPVASLTQVS